MSKNLEELDKQKVIEFFKSKGIGAHPLPEQGDNKTPDFELYEAGKLWGYCELKSIREDDWSGGSRHDPAYNTIQNKLHESCKQLRSANSNHELPNIIFILNHNPHRGYPDLWTVLRGEFSPENSSIADPRYINRLIVTGDILVIDYIIWIDSNQDIAYFFIGNSCTPYEDILKEKISRKAYEKLNFTSETL